MMSVPASVNKNRAETARSHSNDEVKRQKHKQDICKVKDISPKRAEPHFKKKRAT